jgi:hypothetical protein
MTKQELLRAIRAELDTRHMYSMDGIGANCTKSELQNALDCLRATDEQMADYLTVIKIKYPNTYRTVTQTDYLRHSHNRLYVYNTARLVLA